MLYFLEPILFVILVIEQRTVETVDAEQIEVCVWTRDEHVSVGTEPNDGLEVGQGVREGRQLLVRIGEVIRRGDIFGSDEIVAEDHAHEVYAFGQDRGNDRTVGIDLRATELQVFNEIGTLRCALHWSSEIGACLQHNAEELGGDIENGSIKVCDVGHRMPPLVGYVRSK